MAGLSLRAVAPDAEADDVPNTAVVELKEESLPQSPRPDAADVAAVEPAAITVKKAPAHTVNWDAVPMVATLKESLQDSLLRVHDFFWRTNKSCTGQIKRSEFIAAVRAVGHKEEPDAEIAAVFAQIDADGDGLISYRELNRALRTRVTVVPKSPPPSPSPRRHARTHSPLRESPTRVTVRGDEATVEPYVGSFLDLLSINLLRVIKRFEELDHQQLWGGDLNRVRFREGCASLGLDAVPDPIDDAFDLMDIDGDGYVQLDELDEFLRKRTPIGAQLAPGAAVPFRNVRDADGELTLTSCNPTPLRHAHDFSTHTNAARAAALAASPLPTALVTHADSSVPRSSLPRAACIELTDPEKVRSRPGSPQTTGLRKPAAAVKAPRPLLL